jgi:hypothetical protein
MLDDSMTWCGMQNRDTQGSRSIFGVQQDDELDVTFHFSSPQVETKSSFTIPHKPTRPTPGDDHTKQWLMTFCAHSHVSPQVATKFRAQLNDLMAEVPSPMRRKHERT